MMAVVFEYALRLKNVFVNEKYILISGLIKKEKVSLSNIKKFKYHPLLYRMVRRPFVIEFEKETSFGKKIYFFPTIAAKSGSINFLEVFDIKEELEKKIEEIKQSR